MLSDDLSFQIFLKMKVFYFDTVHLLLCALVHKQMMPLLVTDNMEGVYMQAHGNSSI